MVFGYKFLIDELVKKGKEFGVKCVFLLVVFGFFYFLMMKVIEEDFVNFIN